MGLNHDDYDLMYGAPNAKPPQTWLHWVLSFFKKEPPTVGPWRAEIILSGYQPIGYKIRRGDEEPIARTIVKDEVDDEAAAELIVNALNYYENR